MDVQVWLGAINKVYGFMILGVLKLGCISRYTPWDNAIPMYNVKLVDVFSGLLYSRPIKFQKKSLGITKTVIITNYNDRQCNINRSIDRLTPKIIFEKKKDKK